MKIAAKVVNQILANKIQQHIKKHIKQPRRGIPGGQDDSIIEIPLILFTIIITRLLPNAEKVLDKIQKSMMEEENSLTIGSKE